MLKIKEEERGKGGKGDGIKMNHWNHVFFKSSSATIQIRYNLKLWWRLKELRSYGKGYQGNSKWFSTKVLKNLAYHSASGPLLLCQLIYFFIDYVNLGWVSVTCSQLHLNWYNLWVKKLRKPANTIIQTIFLSEIILVHSKE